MRCNPYLTSQFRKVELGLKPASMHACKIHNLVENCNLILYAGENMSFCSLWKVMRTCLAPSYHPIQEVHQILKLVPQDFSPYEKKNSILIINNKLNTVFAEHFEIVGEEKKLMTLGLQRRAPHW